MSDLKCQESGLLKKVPYAYFVYFKLATFVPAFTGIYAIFKYSESLFFILGFILIFLVHLSIIYRIKCTHCTYYRMPGNTLECMWLWGVPKLFNENPGPEGKINKYYTPAGIALVAFYPIFWLVNDWALLIIYFSSIAVLVCSLYLFICSNCTYFECGYNTVSQERKGSLSQ